MLIDIQWENFMKKINIFIHTWKINNWRKILEEQLSHIHDSGLGDIASVHICNLNKECKTYNEMWKHSLDNDSYYLYLQNLGITWQETKYEDITTNWRRWIMDGVVGNWKEYVKYLDEYDMVADNWKDTLDFKDLDRRLIRRSINKDLSYPQHFAPQMWWTKSSYLRKVENPLEYEKKSPLGKGFPRVFMEGWPTALGKNFKEIRNDFTHEPTDAYNHQHLKNMPNDAPYRLK